MSAARAGVSSTCRLRKAPAALRRLSIARAGEGVTSTLELGSDEDADVAVRAGAHRTEARTSTRCRRYTQLAAEYTSTIPGSVRIPRSYWMIRLPPIDVT
jgi:hypothetical protein